MEQSLPEMDYEQAEELLRQSWEVHRQAFGPILEPAFAEDDRARILLVGALNEISRREVKQGMDRLQQLRAFCTGPEDWAAWFFFAGLCFEMAGAQPQMLQCYRKSCTFGHRFYLPYLKLARAAHKEADFETAGRDYVSAIECLSQMEEDDREDAALAAAYTNLVSCLTMMHRYAEAEQLWNTAVRSLPLRPGSAATAAVLFAAMGNAQKVEVCLARLKQEASPLLDQTRQMTQMILQGEHPHFTAAVPPQEACEAFWQWFEAQSPQLLQDTGAAAAALSARLKELLPYLDRDPVLHVTGEGERRSVTLCHRFARSLEASYRSLVDCCPPGVAQHWHFTVTQ